MKEFQGTPGPWVADKTSRAVGLISRDDDQSYGILIPVAWVEFDQDVGIQTSNQRLIAAAPELLEALQNMIGAFDNPIVRRKLPSTFNHEAIQSARAAINKALGE